MKFLLIMPKLANNIHVKYNFPLGLAYISAAMKAAALAVDTVNPNHNGESIESVVARLAGNYDAILSGGLSGQFHSVKVIFDTAKRVNPHIVTIAGGGLITANPVVSMQALETADIAVVGEGEETTVELCRALEKGAPLDTVAGIVFKGSDGRISQTERRPEIANLDSIPFPDLDGFDIETYLHLSSQTMFGTQGERTFFLLTARSCPYNCSFCFHTVGNKYRLRTLENIFSEIELLNTKYGVQQFVLSDELFAASKERVRKFSEYMKSRKLSWYATFRLDQVDDELIAIIKNSTCKQMFFGIESVNDSILKSMRKNLTRKTIETSIKKVFDADIPFGGNLLFGDPKDTVETCRENLEWYKRHPEYNLSLINISCYPGTQIYQDALRRGIIRDEVQFLRDGCPVINISSMSERECATIQQEILEVGNGFPLKDQKLHSFNAETRQARVEGECRKCGKHIVSENILLLTKDYSYIYCPQCGAKHNACLPDEMAEKLEDKIALLLTQNRKIALWGVQPATWEIFNRSSVYTHPGITFVDSNGARRALKLTAAQKPIFPPKIFKEKHFDSVLFFYPHLYATYQQSIQSDYPLIENFTDALELMGETANQ